MFADTAAIETAGIHLTRTAADLQALAAALPSTAQPYAAAFGPVGADFLSALAAALAETSRSVTDLGDDLAGAAGTAAVTAGAYVDAEHRSIATLGG
ncbi:MAG: type VII secretion target [Mycobacterium sp.]